MLKTKIIEIERKIRDQLARLQSNRENMAEARSNEDESEHLQRLESQCSRL